MLVIIDLENTISNSSDRMWLLKYQGKNDDIAEEYKKQFQESFIDDYLNLNVKMFMDTIYKNRENVIVILTAKDIKYESLVKQWLEHNGVPYDVLIMKENKLMTDLEFKEDYVIKNKHLIDFALDDVGANCAMFATHNIPCLRIEQK